MLERQKKESAGKLTCTVQLRSKEESRSNRELGVVKNKLMAAGSRTSCLQLSLHISYISSKLCFQSPCTQNNLFCNGGLKTCLSTISSRLE